MASIHSLELRIAALEARLQEVEGGYGNTLYRLRRSTVKTDLRLAKVMEHLNVADVSDAEVDEVLDAES